MSSSSAFRAFASPPAAQLMLAQSGDQRRMPVAKTPFTIGRKPDKDLVIPDPRVSRDHAEIRCEEGEFFLVDLASKHGTWVNGRRVDRHKLSPNDHIAFGARDETFAVFNPERASSTNAARDFLMSQISARPAQGSADLEKLTLYLEAARKLNTVGVLEEILVTLIETTLRLTGAERGFVFTLEGGELRLAAGRNSKGQVLVEDNTISHSALKEAATSASEFLMTDTSRSGEMAQRQSIVANELRTVICIPLRRTHVQERATEEGENKKPRDVRAVLYLDSRFSVRNFSQVSHDIIRAIATEAAALLENAHLVQVEEASRRYQQELAIAASIQQRLMAVVVPDVPFAAVHARSIACTEIGGDFFDVIYTQHGLTVVLADVCGKGVSAALLASIVQGMIYSLTFADMPLAQIADTCNRFLIQKEIGSKYATLFMARLCPTGLLEFVNCGHVPPLLFSDGNGRRVVEGANLPVGLLPDAAYTGGQLKMKKGDRLLIVSDGVTEAENDAGDFFGDARLESLPIPASLFAATDAAPAGASVPTAQTAAPSVCDLVFNAVKTHCGATAATDDCTALELLFRG